MTEEIELYKTIEEKEEEIEEDPPIIVEGDVIININRGEKVDIKKLRNRITKPLKRKIKKRDLEKCLCCGKTFKTHLEVHHIMPISEYPSLATDSKNMASLCQQCHAKYHEMYKDKEGAVTFALFLKQYGKM